MRNTPDFTPKSAQNAYKQKITVADIVSTTVTDLVAEAGFEPATFGLWARGYNAPCFESVVHNFVGSILMRWDNEDRKDRLSIALAIQNETKHFQVVSSNFQVQYWVAAW